jgi:hypothetical protein
MNAIRFSTAVMVFVLAASAGAQQPAGQGDSAKPALSADTFKLPSWAYDTTKPNLSRAKPGPENFNPGRFDLGDSVLQFDTKRQPSGSRVGIEAIDPKRLGGISKDDTTSPLPNYFGMTLSKPLN